MINVSDKLKEESKKKHNYYVTANVALSDGTNLSLKKEDFWLDGNDIIDAADSGDFPLGLAIEKTATLSLVNENGKFAEYSFNKAVFTIFMNLELSDRLETFRRGSFIVCKKPAVDDEINLTLLDYMSKADRTYKTNLIFPCTAGEVLEDACQQTGIILGDADFENSDYQVKKTPEGTTYRAVIGMVAALAGGNARIDEDDLLRIVTFDTAEKRQHDLISISDIEHDIDPVHITGVRYSDGDTEYFYGDEGYVIDVSDNKLLSGNEEDGLNRIGQILKGFELLPFSLSSIPVGYATFGDSVRFKDSKGNQYKSYITDVEFNFADSTEFSCSAKSIEEQELEYPDNVRVIVDQAIKAAEKKVSTYDTKLKQMNDMAANSLGFYYTEEPQPDGSVIVYRHNKPNLAESKIVYKTTADGFFVTSDYQGTDAETTATGKWTSGFDANGDAVLNILYAIGIQSKWINTRGLTAKDNDGNITFRVNADTGEVEMDPKMLIIGKGTLNDKLSEMEESIASSSSMTLQLSNDYQSISVDANGNYTQFPECSTTAVVLYGTEDVTDSCSFSIATSQSVTGTWNADNKTYTVTELTSDSGWIDIKATYLKLSVTKRFSISKLYAGKDGLQGLQGPDGKQGIQGPQGPDGRTQYTHIAYANSADGKTDFSVGDSNREYVGMYADFTETDSEDPSKYHWTLIKGADGKQGIQGPQGPDGKTPYFHTAYANSADGKTDFSLDDSTDKTYIGHYTDYVSADSTDPSKYTWVKIKGDPGVAGRTYFLQANAEILLMGADKKITPNNLSIRLYYRDGQGTAESQYGWWKIEKSSDKGNNWSEVSTVYTSSMKLISIAVDTMSLSAHDMIRVSVYADKAKTILYDQQTFSVAVDVDSLTQADIVEILSDGGKWKGVYYNKEDNTLYISFDAAKGGTVLLGGPNNGNGQLKLYDENGDEALRLNSGGMAMNSASDDAITIFRLLRTGLYYYDSTGKKRKVSIDTGGLALYTDYTDANNYKSLKLGKYGLYAAEKSGGVEEIWMEGDTEHQWDGYIIRFLNGLVRINANAIYTDGSSMGNNLTTSGTLSVAKTAGLKGGAYVQGSLTFEDYEETSKNSPTRKRPVASAGTNGTRVAYLTSGTGTTTGLTGTHRRLGIRAQWGSTSTYTLDYLYSDGQVSDIRLKENVKDSEVKALETINQMKVRQFDWRRERGGWHQEIGFVADELEKIDPNLAMGGGYDENGEMDIKQINSTYLLSYAVKAIQELSTIVKNQNKHIEELERRLS